MRITVYFLAILIFLSACSSPQTAAQPPLAASPIFFTGTATPELSHTASPEPSLTTPPTATITATAAATLTPTSTSTPTPAVLVGAGDVAVCGEPYDDATADLLAGIDGTIFVAGDVVYDQGAQIEYERCFDPTWGRFKERIRPAPGNHDYKSPGAQPYFDYFGSAAGEPGRGWYAYTLGDWRIIVLNSNCDDVSCKDGSPQVEWLRQELAANSTRCSLAYFHHPRWSSGPAGSAGWMAPFWRVLYEGGVDVVIGAHDHHYERFAPQDPNGSLDLERGIRQFVVGTGGGYTRFVGAPIENSEIIGQHVFGVLKLELFPERYSWEFIPIEGYEFTDSGADVCR
jgi:acid phosphatase type 7